MLLSGTRDQKFLGLRIAEEAQHGVLFHQFVDAGAQLVFVSAALGLNRKRDGRFRQLHPRILNGRALVAQSVAGQRVSQFCHGADIAGMQFIHRDRGLPLHDGNVRQLLLRAAREILQRRVVL